MPSNRAGRGVGGGTPEAGTASGQPPHVSVRWDMLRGPGPAPRAAAQPIRTIMCGSTNGRKQRPADRLPNPRDELDRAIQACAAGSCGCPPPRGSASFLSVCAKLFCNPSGSLSSSTVLYSRGSGAVSRPILWSRRTLSLPSRPSAPLCALLPVPRR